MALQLDEVLLNIGLVILEGLVLGIILNYWQDWNLKKKDKKDMAFLINYIFKALFVDKDPSEAFYFIKLSGEREKTMIQQVLKLELKEESTGGKGIRLVLNNMEFGLILDPSHKLSHLVTYKIKVEEGKPTPQRFYYNEPPPNVKSFDLPFNSFKKYFEKRAKMFGLRL